jgi:transcriptional activator SPT7
MTSTPSRAFTNGFHRASATSAPGSNPRPRRDASMVRDAAGPGLGAASLPAEEDERDADPIHIALRQCYSNSEAIIADLFGPDGPGRRALQQQPTPSRNNAADGPAPAEPAKTPAPPKRLARQIDDDYGDDDEDEEEDAAEKESPLKAKAKAGLLNGLSPQAMRSPAPPLKPPVVRANTATSSEQAKSSEDVRKQLEDDKKHAAATAKRSFQAAFFTLEHDGDAMVEQQKMDEMEREVENEISGGANATSSGQPPTSGSAAAATSHGTLGSADLGASSLTLKHLIARIDLKRNEIAASDSQLRTLIAEVRRGRSKWASEDRVGQEELYEAAEKVLQELKAMTGNVEPFLQRVSKREAQDYFLVIKQPMDIGTMTKKLKQYNYKSKKEFVDDLHLIWSNALEYNKLESHPIRKKALYMRKETEKLIPLIPDIVVRDRAEIEAEERRQNSLDADESDDDDAPIMASRGRKAPKKGGKGAPSSARKAPPVNVDDTSATPDRDVKPAMHATGSSGLRNSLLRAESELQDASSLGFSTPPPGGTQTPSINGVHGSGVPPSQVDAMDIDGPGNSTIISTPDDADEDDTEFKTWKQVTKKDRAAAAAARNRLFRGNQLNPEEPALLRTKAGMRRWMRQQRMLSSDRAVTNTDATEGAQGEEDEETSAPGETLAEGIEKDEDSTLPDYYDPLSAIPDLPDRWRWTTDSEGHVMSQNEEWMRMHPKSRFRSTGSRAARAIDESNRLMQETRKISIKIGLVKQMQMQGQTHQSQFQKYDPQPFVEQDVDPVVLSENGPLMAPWLTRAALQRSVGKLFYHAGFEEFQPSAMETATDLAAEYFTKLVEGFKVYREQPKKYAKTPRFTLEEQVLHSLLENGLDVEGLESYVRDDVERHGAKLTVVHDRMKNHLADLLVSFLPSQSAIPARANNPTATRLERTADRPRRNRCDLPRRQRGIRPGRLCHRRTGRRLLRLQGARSGRRTRAGGLDRPTPRPTEPHARRVPGAEPRASHCHWCGLLAAPAVRPAFARAPTFSNRSGAGLLPPEAARQP